MEELSGATSDRCADRRGRGRETEQTSGGDDDQRWMASCTGSVAPATWTRMSRRVRRSSWRRRPATRARMCLPSERTTRASLWCEREWRAKVQSATDDRALDRKNRRHG